MFTKTLVSCSHFTSAGRPPLRGRSRSALQRKQRKASSVVVVRKVFSRPHSLTHSLSLSLSTYLCGEGGVSQNVPNGAPRHNVNQGEPGRVSRAENLGLLRIVVSAIDKKVR